MKGQPKSKPRADQQRPPVFTPALKQAEEDLAKYLDTFCYLVVSHDWYWGRGKSIEEGAWNCVKQGASRKANATALLILGDETAEVNEAGQIIRDAGSHNITVLSRIRLGALITRSKRT